MAILRLSNFPFMHALLYLSLNSVVEFWRGFIEQLLMEVVRADTLVCSWPQGESVRYFTIKFDVGCSVCVCVCVWCVCVYKVLFN